MKRSIALTFTICTLAIPNAIAADVECVLASLAVRS